MKKEELYLIAHRKWVVSPCQHLTFCLGALAGYGAIALILILRGASLRDLPKVVPLFWSFGYAGGQYAIGSLPKYLNHNSFNILVHGGTGEEDPNLEGDQRWVAHADLSPELNFDEPNNTPAPPPTDWNEILNRENIHLRQVDDANLRPNYLEFKSRVRRQLSPQDLLSMPQLSVDQSYRLFALAVHPDRNGPRREEAEALCHILNAAKERINTP